ncbi:MAG: DUF3089 domain-containing protein [Propionibacteriaceae bacterium]|jgi:hypothetical protein|nr:DUF3089 domain-containing protein [Propionibacteriaceae bacterium]
MDYSIPENWYLHPERPIPGAPDVFVITPTFVFDPGKPTYLRPDDPEYLAGNEEFATIAVRPVFDTLAVNVWMPKYHQVNGAHLVGADDPMSIFFNGGPTPVTADIFNAFTHLTSFGDSPIIVFSHSQGSILNGYLLTVLLPELPETTQTRLAADYLIGWGLNDTILERTRYRASTSPTDTGTIISWNTATCSEVATKHRATWGDASTRAVNPITFDTTSEPISAAENGRSLLCYHDDPTPRLTAGLTGARLLRPSDEGGLFAGQVVLVDVDERTFRDEESICGQDKTNLGYTHHWDISLFVDTINHNLRQRLGIAGLPGR